MGASEGAGTPEGGEETQSPMAGMESATVEGNIQASQMNTDGGLPAGITGALADSQSLGGNFAGGSPPMEMYNKKVRTIVHRSVYHKF